MNMSVFEYCRMYKYSISVPTHFFVTTLLNLCLIEAAYLRPQVWCEDVTQHGFVPSYNSYNDH